VVWRSMMQRRGSRPAFRRKSATPCSCNARRYAAFARSGKPLLRISAAIASRCRYGSQSPAASEMSKCSARRGVAACDHAAAAISIAANRSGARIASICWSRRLSPAGRPLPRPRNSSFHTPFAMHLMMPFH
jgi:hypothetical protein